MEQEHRITYNRGITRKPSDFLCGDGELAECINLTTDAEELKPVVQPVAKIQSNNLANKILFIHKYDGEKRYITFSWRFVPRGVRINSELMWFTEQNGELVYGGSFEFYFNRYDDIKVTSIGKALIVNTYSGLRYFLWKSDGYDEVGLMPSLQPNFWLTTGDGQSRVYNSGSAKDIIFEDGGNLKNPPVDNIEAHNNLVIGLYNKNLKAVARKKGFCRPFLVRAALELQDGTYMQVTQPVLMWPSVTNNSYSRYMWGSNNLNMYTYFKHLRFSQLTDYSRWSDIVKSITVFVSDEIRIHDTDCDQSFSTLAKAGERVTWDGIYRSGNSTLSQYHTDNAFNGGTADYTTYQPLVAEDQDHILSEIKSTSVFYKVCSFGLKPISNGNTADLIDKYTLENLTTQDRLETDDYFSRCEMIPEYMYAYNGRLDLANVKRKFFEGFDHFMPYDNQTASDYAIYVKIAADTQDVWVRHEIKASYQKPGLYFFYPDPRAKHVTIYDSLGQCWLDQDLTEHPGLNGAYYLKGIPGITGGADQATVTPGSSAFQYGYSGMHSGSPAYDNDAREALTNYVIVSELDNPWTFKAEGYNKVSTGRILAISTTTQALSQAQYGPFPLLVFSDEGIWSMSVDQTGLYKDVQPISREVLLGQSSIIQTDNAVFFATMKGLMVATAISSRDVDVRCVSERIDGKPFDLSGLSGLAANTEWSSVVSAASSSQSFQGFICADNTFMAYDYLNSQLLILNASATYCYVYHIKDGTFTKQILPTTMMTAINDYPDYLLQGNDNHLYSLYGKPLESSVATRQLGVLVTRPMKLAGPVSQASLRQMKNVGSWIEGTSQTPLSYVKTKVFLSEDMKTWYQATSRFGAAARYYRLAIFVKMLPSERLSGTILTTQTRRNDNMR